MSMRGEKSLSTLDGQRCTHIDQYIQIFIFNDCVFKTLSSSQSLDPNYQLKD